MATNERYIQVGFTALREPGILRNPTNQKGER